VRANTGPMPSPRRSSGWSTPKHDQPSDYWSQQGESAVGAPPSGPATPAPRPPAPALPPPLAQAAKSPAAKSPDPSASSSSTRAASRRAAPPSNPPRNSEITVGTHNLRPWLPGVSGNPAGRPKGLATLSQAIVERTGQGLQLVEWHLAIWRGDAKPLGKRPTPAQRFEAAQWLTERGWGKAPVQIDVSAPSVIVVTGSGDVE
jgi:hypothetical protein